MELDVLSMKWLSALLFTACASSAPPPESAPPPPSPPVPAPVAPPVVADAGTPTPEASAPEAAAVEAEASAPLPLPEGTTVLHIGDSMAGALGIELNKALKAQGVHGVLHFKTASFIPTWAWSKELPLYLAQTNPDLVLITLGTNEVQIQDPSIRAKTIQKLVQSLGDRPCVWILPPLWEAGDTGLLPVIRDNAAPCRIMDSNQVYPGMKRLSDHIHPTIPARAEWAKRVVEWLQRERRPTPEKPWALAPRADSH